MRIKRRRTDNPQNILLTNGRFPVSLDLARQLKRGGHYVFCVDPMEYHVCKFSNAVKKSWEVPVPHVDAEGFIRGVRKAIDEAKIDLIIPLHEEIFFLVESDDDEIRKRLFAPPFEVLIRMHNKWEFSRFLLSIGLDAPKTWLCKNLDDVRYLDLTKDLALKPVYGRAASKVYRIGPSRPIPDDVDVSEENHYIAQEWLTGQRYCSYSVVRKGRTQAFALYPVQDTIDGSSCVYFESTENPRIRAYTEKIIFSLGPNFTGQLAFDFIDTGGGRLVAIECNPRATSGIHLFSGRSNLATAFTTELPSGGEALAKPGHQRQVAPGMMMWERSHGVKAFLQHQKRLLGTKDVMFTTSDMLPVLMQPFLLTSYYEICRERKMRLADMFQWDVTWEPEGEHLEKVRRMLDEAEWMSCSNSTSETSSGTAVNYEENEKDSKK